VDFRFSGFPKVRVVWACSMDTSVGDVRFPGAIWHTHWLRVSSRSAQGQLKSRFQSDTSVSTLKVAGACEPQVDLSHMSIPVLVHSVTIERGAELVVHWAMPVVKNTHKTKSVSWFDESVRLSKKQRTTK
jgi:hypothetical protein